MFIVIIAQQKFKMFHRIHSTDIKIKRLGKSPVEISANNRYFTREDC